MTATPQEFMPHISELMRSIDLCALITHKQGAIVSRPMSTNGEVDYDGDSHFFTRLSSGVVADIAHDPEVALMFHRTPGLLAGAPVFVHVQGRAEVIQDRARFAKHWHSSVDAWFEDGIDSTDLCMLKIHAHRVAFWDGMEHGDIVLA